MCSAVLFIWWAKSKRDNLLHKLSWNGCSSTKNHCLCFIPLGCFVNRIAFFFFAFVENDWIVLNSAVTIDNDAFKCEQTEAGTSRNDQICIYYVCIKTWKWLKNYLCTNIFQNFYFQELFDSCSFWPECWGFLKSRVIGKRLCGGKGVCIKRPLTQTQSSFNLCSCGDFLSPYAFTNYCSIRF